MGYSLFLDDLREPKSFWLKHINSELWVLYDEKEWVVVKNYDEFVKQIHESGLPELISFDHDLADQHYAPEDQWHRYNDWAKEMDFKEKTGADCAQFLVDYCLDNNLELPNYLVHSQNPSGADNIRLKLDRFRRFQLTGK